MSKSITPVVTPATLPGATADGSSKNSGDGGAGVSFSSLMQAPEAAGSAPKDSGKPRADTEEAQQVVNRTAGLITDAQEATGLAGLLPSADNAEQPQPKTQASPALLAELATAAHGPAVPAGRPPVWPGKPVPATAVLPANNRAAGLNTDPAAALNSTVSLPEDVVLQQVAGIAVSAAAVRFSTGDLAQNSLPAETLASAVKAAVQLAVAQAGSEGLKQSLSEGHHFQPDLNALATRTGVNTAAMPFADTLVETTPSPASSRVAVSVGQQGWGRAVGEQVIWFISQNVNAASLRLNPQHLGPLEMQVNMDGDKANVAFISQHATVREALDSALPRLRELFAENGLSLGDVHVSQHGASGRRDQDDSASAQLAGDAADAGGADALGMESAVEENAPTSLGLVDYYA